jgi:hypothetical protein
MSNLNLPYLLTPRENKEKYNFNKEVVYTLSNNLELSNFIPTNKTNRRYRNYKQSFYDDKTQNKNIFQFLSLDLISKTRENSNYNSYFTESISMLKSTTPSKVTNLKLKFKQSNFNPNFASVTTKKIKKENNNYDSCKNTFYKSVKIKAPDFSKQVSRQPNKHNNIYNFNKKLNNHKFINKNEKYMQEGFKADHNLNDDFIKKCNFKIFTLFNIFHSSTS